MKKVTEIVDSIGPYGVRDDWITALREYGAQVREEAAQIIGSCKSGCFAFSVCGHCQQRAEEVRKMELP